MNEVKMINTGINHRHRVIELMDKNLIYFQRSTPLLFSCCAVILCISVVFVCILYAPIDLEDSIYGTTCVNPRAVVELCLETQCVNTTT